MKNFLKIFLLTTAIASCSLYTNPKLPENKITAWNETTAVSKTKTDQKWWKNFNDPALNELIEKAGKNSKDLKITTARIKQARADEQSVLADYLPVINANADATRSKNSTTLLDRPILRRYSNNYRADFDASWEIDLLGAEPSIRASKQWSEKSREDYNAALVTLYGDVATYYFNVRKLQAQANALKNKQNEILEKLKLQKSLFNAGKIDGVELSRIENEAANAESEREIINNNVKQSIYALEALVGLTPGSLKDVFAKPYQVKTPSTQIITGAPSEVLAQRPDVRSAEKSYIYSTSLQDVAVTQFFPRISIAGLLGYETGRESLLFNSRSSVFQAAGGLTVPLFDWKRIRADMLNADASAEESLVSYEKAVITALSDVESSFAGYKSSKDNLNIMNRAYNATATEVSINKERYNKGLTSYLDYSDSKIKLEDSRYNLEDTKFENLIQTVRVYKALGGGWDK